MDKEWTSIIVHTIIVFLGFFQPCGKERRKSARTQQRGQVEPHAREGRTVGTTFLVLVLNYNNIACAAESESFVWKLIFTSKGCSY